MKKFTGRYTTNTAKALKGSERILCQVSEDGTIYICNGFLLCTMNAPEYAATVQPLTCCEPGAWTFDKDGKHEDEAHKLDLVKLFADTVRDTADAAPLARAPFTVQAKKAPAACYYNADADFAAIYDTKFIDALHPAAQLRTTSAISAALAYINDEPFAVVMPIRAEPNAARAIRAFFTEAAEANTKTDEADKLRAELAQAQEEAAALRGDLYRAANEIDELKNKLAELHETKTEQPAEQKPEPKTAAEIIAARWAEVDGLTATIKGATTAAPVVWLAGDTKPHEKEIEAAGASPAAPPPGRALMGNTKTKTQEEHKMKTAGYWPCRNEIINAHLSTPHKYEPFTELFDVDQLDAIRDKYGVDLYRECYADALHEVTEAANITTHLRALGVECKPIFTPDDCRVNYIAVFSLGNATAQRINEIARKADLCVLFQCPTH